MVYISNFLASLLKLIEFLKDASDIFPLYLDSSLCFISILSHSDNQSKLIQIRAILCSLLNLPPNYYLLNEQNS